LYRAYALGFDESIVTPQKSESAVSAALANKICCAEPFLVGAQAQS